MKHILKQLFKSLKHWVFVGFRAFIWLVIDAWLVVSAAIYAVPVIMRTIASIGDIKFNTAWEHKVMYWLAPSALCILFLAIALGWLCYLVYKATFQVFDDAKRVFSKQLTVVEKNEKIKFIDRWVKKG